MQQLAAESGVTFRHYVPHLSALFDSLDALVCMGGYNTLVEAAALGVPTVCVPRVAPRTEQLLRAEAFARLGLLQVCRPEQLDSPTLRDQITLALQSSREDLRARAHRALHFDGAQQAARRMLSLATESAPPARANPRRQQMAVA